MCYLFLICSLTVKAIITSLRSSISKHAGPKDSVMENERESKKERDREIHGSNWRIKLDRFMEQ